MKKDKIEQSKLKALVFFILLVITLAELSGCKEKLTTVKEVMDKTITELYAARSESELSNLTYEQALSLFSRDERKILATRHWIFTVNVPVVVSVMRSAEQVTVPFWLEPAGFIKTELTMKNEMTTYEIWQKNFHAGEVGLGINGFENYSLHYFVSVAPGNKNDTLVLSNFYPENQYEGILDNGAFTYHDWDELVLEDVPEAMKGQKLLTTIRGRGVETHLVGAFRKTEYPSSKLPDQVMLTWSSDPSTSVDIQWRTDTTVKTGAVYYRISGVDEFLVQSAEESVMEDLCLMNDRFIRRFTAELRNLNPGTNYEYRLEGQSDWPQNQTFSTSANDKSLSFIWFGDTHYSSEFGQLMRKADSIHPDVAFFSIAGDLVSDGLHRDQWDALFECASPVISRKPLMSVPGNHDNRSGLGAWMYRELFSYPKNGPDGVEKEQTYAFTYKNVLFLMIDATSSVNLQARWIEEQLAASDATWKFAVFHFPPYNWEEPYYDIQNAWVPVFDKYHVDMVMSGHIHYYMRSKPMKGGIVTDSFSDGTVYTISIGIPSHTGEMTDEPYAEVRKGEGQFYQYVKIDGNKLTYMAVDSEGNFADSLIVKK